MDPLLVCHEFYDAGIEAYHTSTTFGFENVSHLRALSKGLGVERRRYLKRIMMGMKWELDGSTTVPQLKYPIWRPAAMRWLQTDNLTPFPLLQKAVVRTQGVSPLTSENEVNATHRAKRELKQRVKEAWSSKADAIKFRWTPWYFQGHHHAFEDEMLAGDEQGSGS